VELAGIEEAMVLAERRWGIVFKRQGHNEASGACPFCRDGIDRFRIWVDGGWWCRQCEKQGWLDDDKRQTLTLAEKNALAIRALERKQAEHERRLSAIERMLHCTDHIAYHKLLDNSDRQWWHEQGIHDPQIDEYKLGICYNCPTAPRHVSYTIPVYDSTWTKLLNIRHRLADATTGDRYRPHMAGLPGKLLFNARWTQQHEEIVLVEGAKKSIVVSAQAMPAVGIFGAAGFDMRWLPHFSNVKRLYVALDPDVPDKAMALGRDIASNSKMDVRVATFPTKPDDFFLVGGTPKEFRDFLRWAKKGQAG